jgi:hypothetical protein
MARNPHPKNPLLGEPVQMPEKPKPHEDPHCVCDPCSAWMLDQMDLRTRTTAQQQAEEDEHLFAILDRLSHVVD